MDKLNKWEACQLLLEQEISKGLTEGKSKPSIGREIHKWLKEKLGVEYAARVIERRARRVEDAQKLEKENGSVDPTVENPIPGTESAPPVPEPAVVTTEQAVLPAAEPKGPDPAKFKDRFKIDPVIEDKCKDLIKEWDMLSWISSEQATAMRILLKRMKRGGRDLFLSIIYNSTRVEIPELKFKLKKAAEEIRKYKEQQAGMDRTNLNLQNRILELKDALKEAGGIDPGETDQERYLRLGKVISREQVKEDLGAEGATPEAPEKSEDYRKLELALVESNHKNYRLQAQLRDMQDYKVPEPAPEKSEEEQEFIEKQHQAHISELEAKVAELTEEQQLIEKPRILELEAKIDELMKAASMVSDPQFRGSTSAVGRSVVRNLEKIPKTDFERNLAFEVVFEWMRNCKLPPKKIGYLKAVPQANPQLPEYNLPVDFQSTV